MNARTGSVVRLLAIVAGTAIVAWALAMLLGPGFGDPTGDSASNATGRRSPGAEVAVQVVSLSPGITEVLEELGRASSLVGISDYCATVHGREDLPRVGTALTPNYEAILTTSPDLILTQGARDTPLDELRQLAPTHSLPWDTSEDLVRAIVEIGRLTGAEHEAADLAARVDSTLHGPQPGIDAPVVLLVLEHSAGQLTEAWYVKDDTIHGDALRAAGARNAIPPGDTGVPRLSLERVLTVDPDAILVLSTRDSVPDREAAGLLDDWRELSTLQAVRSNRLALVTGDRLYVTGPRVLSLVMAIRGSLESLGLGPEWDGAQGASPGRERRSQ